MRMTFAPSVIQRCAATHTHAASRLIAIGRNAAEGEESKPLLSFDFFSARALRACLSGFNLRRLGLASG